ncbi:MAG: helix-turn-helix transcriptional regulator [Rhodospirillales bacterium]|nr:helix-turn-helix transcriptional regulator [Acetobacter sp.]
MQIENCPVAYTLRFIGGKWKPLILNELKAGPVRTGALLRRIPQVTPKMLTQQTRELEQAGLVARTVFPDKALKVEYSLTELGQSLRPVLEAMANWGLQHR